MKWNKWKKIILWTFAVLVALVAGLTIVAVLAVRQSPSVRRSILARVELSILESSGAQVTIRDFRLDLSRLSLQLDGIVARGRGPQSAPPLLQVEQVAADIKLDSVFKRQWHLQDLVIHHPVVHVSVDKSGMTNLPQPSANSGSGIAPIFDLAIQKCLIDSGEIYFNDVKNSLEAEVHNLQLNAGFDRALSRYHGVLSYSQGKIRYGGYAPVVHNLETKFGLTQASLTVERLAVATGQSRIDAHGEVENFSSPSVHAVYDIQLMVGDVARVLKDASLLEGAVHLTGSLTHQGRDNTAFLESSVLAGEASSAALQLKTQAGHMEVHNLSAAYKLAGGNLEIQNIRAQTFGGTIHASLTIRDFAGAPHSRLQAHLRDISLERIEAAAQQYPLPEAHLRGTISADTDASWGRTLADLTAHADATLQGTLGQNPSAPLSGAVHADYAAARHEIELRQSYVRTPATSLTLDGKVSRYSQLQVEARSSNLHELELLGANLKTTISHEPPPKLDLYGAASFSGFITGLVTEPQLKGKLEASNLRVKGSAWKLLRANVEAGPLAVSLSGGSLETATQGKINFSLQTGLEKWTYTPASPINVEISASRITASDFGWLTGQAYPVSGTLSGNASVHGSQLNPVGHGEINLTGGKILSEPIQSVALKFQGDGKAVRASLLVHLPAGTAQAQMTIDPKTQGYQAQIQAENIRLEHLQMVKQRHLAIVGAVSLDANGHGTIAAPEFTATMKVSQLEVQKQTIRGVTLAVHVHDQLAELTLNSEVAQTNLKGNGTVKIKPPYTADLHLDTARFSLQPLLALYAPGLDGDVQGQVELHASLSGPLQNPALLEGHLEIPVLTASYQQVQLGAAKPVRVDYRSGVVTLQPTSFQGTGTNMQLQATIPVDDPAKSTYLVEGSVDLGLARMLQPDLKGAGQIQIDLDSRRHVAGSDVIGEVRLVNASLQSADVPLGLDNGNGVLTVSRTRVEVKSLQGQIGGGTVTARGGVTFRPAIQFDLGLSGNEIRLRYPEGVRAVLNSNLTFVGSKQEATLSGNVKVQRLSLTRDFDLQNFLNQFEEQESAAPGDGFTHHVRLNVELQSASQMDVASTMVSLRGNANLRVVGTAAEPVILGRAHLNGGDLFLGGNRYVLQSGAIDFVNPLRTEPIVNAQIKTKINQYDISMTIQGPVESLKTSYTSEPPLPPVDIINLLAFGHTTEGGGSPVAPGNLGAQSALVQGLGSAVSSRVQKFAGLSYFSIDPALGGANQNAGARVVIQERVTSNLVVTYSTDVTSTQRQAIQLEYRLNNRWSVSGVRDQNGGFGGTVNYHKSF
jgi:translocation and assembly module TamB